MAGKNQIQPITKRVGIWVRVSTEQQAQGDSPQNHEQRARCYAESRGWEVATVYRLEAVSGKAVMGHPEAKRMMQDIATGQITGLIFSKLARLGRDNRELLEFADFFQKHGADLISLQEALDTSTPAGRLLYSVLAGLANWEREEIASRVAASIPIRAKQGKPLGGKAPFGYQWSAEKQLIIDPKTAPVRKLVYELFREHRRKRRVVTILNDAGYRTQTGHFFSTMTVERLLRDPVAKGTRRTNYVQHDPSGRVPIGLKPESDWVYVEVEPIVSVELWEQCNRILDEQQTSKYRRPARQAVQLFGGLTWCVCGQKMYVKSNSPKYVCTACHNKIPIEDLEAIFYEQLRDYFLSAEEIGNYLFQANESIKQQEELLEVLNKEQAKVKQEMDRIYQLYQADQIPVHGFGDRYRPLDERYNQLSEEIPRLQAQVDCLKIDILSQDEILTQAHNLYDHWPNFDHNDKRKVIEAIVENITIGHGEIEINLCYLPSNMSPPHLNLNDDDPEPPQGGQTPSNANPLNSKVAQSSEIVARRSRPVAGWSRWRWAAGLIRRRA